MGQIKNIKLHIVTDIKTTYQILHYEGQVEEETNAKTEEEAKKDARSFEVIVTSCQNITYHVQDKCSQYRVGARINLKNINVFGWCEDTDYETENILFYCIIIYSAIEPCHER